MYILSVIRGNLTVFTQYWRQRVYTQCTYGKPNRLQTIMASIHVYTLSTHNTGVNVYKLSVLSTDLTENLTVNLTVYTPYWRQRVYSQCTYGKPNCLHTIPVSSYTLSVPIANLTVYTQYWLHRIHSVDITGNLTVYTQYWRQRVYTQCTYGKPNCLHTILASTCVHSVYLRET